MTPGPEFFKGMVRRFGIYAYLLCGRELNEKIDITLMSVHHR